MNECHRHGWVPKTSHAAKEVTKLSIVCFLLYKVQRRTQSCIVREVLIGGKGRQRNDYFLSTG